MLDSFVVYRRFSSATVSSIDKRPSNIKCFRKTPTTSLNYDKIIQHVLVFERFYDPKVLYSKPTYEMKPRDVRMDPLVAVQRPYCAPVHLETEDPLFILYTSGSTGRPKGLLHSTGGYSLFAKITRQTSFDLQAGDLFACVAYVFL
jgi:acyl-coenzyme A synthetase/AMP-(fatty) acid ligase